MRLYEKSRSSTRNKKEKILNQFTIIKDRTILNMVNEHLGKTPLKYFTQYLKENVFTAVVNNSPEDVLGRFMENLYAIVAEMVKRSG